LQKIIIAAYFSFISAIFRLCSGIHRERHINYELSNYKNAYLNFQDVLHNTFTAKILKLASEVLFKMHIFAMAERVY